MQKDAHFHHSIITFSHFPFALRKLGFTKQIRGLKLYFRRQGQIQSVTHAFWAALFQMEGYPRKKSGGGEEEILFQNIVHHFDSLVA